MSRLPIRARVAIASVAIMGLVLGVTSWVVYARLGDELRHAKQDQLHVRSDDLVADIAGASTLDAHIKADFQVPSDQYAQLLTADGAVVESSPGIGHRSVLTPAERARASQGTIFAARTSVPGLDGPSRMLARPANSITNRYILVIGASDSDRVETLASFRRQLLVGVPTVLLLATLAGYFLAGLSLRPVESMRRRAASISAETAGERLPVPRTRDEIERLGETLNAMLERLEHALQRERDLVADAGHELRTPLALLRTELELALRHATSPEELQDAVRRSAEEVDRLAQLAEALLLIARSDRGALDLRMERIDASELLASVGRRFEWRVDSVGRPIGVTAPRGLALRGDRLRLEQALANMVDNALRYGSGAVKLTAARADGVVELHVTDEGEGFPADFVEHAFERFATADRARTNGSTGLGLAIVRTIAEAHGGTAYLENSRRGGADVWVTVPAAS